MRACLLLLIYSAVLTSFSQPRTMGLVSYSEAVGEGYYLFAPKSGTDIYLVNECGEVVNTWASDYKPGNTDMITPEGKLLSARLLGTNPRIGAGGQGGIIEQYDWDGNLEWSFVISDSFQLAHHEINLLPNGNVLALIWDYRDYDESIQAGRDTALITDAIWSEKIVEFRPILPDSAEIVWEWYLWDHLVQEHDSTKDNYGIVKDYPEKLDINFTIGPVRDWIHANSLDYDPVNDLILMSSRDIDEFYVIDHSTTTAEAATSSGGNFGKGGDFLFRMGNPQVYDAGEADDQTFFDQHNVNWVKAGLSDAGNIMVFNNGRGRPVEEFTEVLKVFPSREMDGSFIFTDDFEVDQVETIYEGFTPTSFYAALLSGASQLEEDRYLISHGPNGEIFEIDDNRNVIWRYVVPINNMGDPLPQGTDPASLQMGLTRQNFIFRGFKYDPDYPGFIGRDITGGDPLELNPIEPLCQDSVISSTADLLNDALFIHPNPVKRGMTVSISNKAQVEFERIVLYNAAGRTVALKDIRPGQYELHIPAQTASGLYILKLEAGAEAQHRDLYKKLVVE